MKFILEEVHKEQVNITEGSDAVLTYYYGESVLQPHFHPVYAPNRQIVTAGMNETTKGHPLGLCFSFGKVNDETGQSIQLHRSPSTFGMETSKSSVTQEIAEFVINTTWKSSNTV